MFTLTPDTNVVVARVKPKDSNHQKAIDALGEYRNKEIELLSEVYFESLRVLSKRVTEVIFEIENAKKSYAETKHIKAGKIDKSHIKPIMKEVREKSNGRNKGFYDDIEKHLEIIAGEGRNPFENMGMIQSLASEAESDRVKITFGLKGTKPCLSCETQEQWKMMRDVKNHLLESNEFFEQNRNGMDRTIASELITIAWTTDHHPIRFMNIDRNFNNALDAVLIETASVFGQDRSKVELEFLEGW